MFFILSGFFAAGKEIRTLRELLKAVLDRYLRLMVPIGIVNVLCFLLAHAGAFPTAEAAELLHSSWLKSYYIVLPSVRDLLHATFTLYWDPSRASLLNGPMWMIKFLFLGSCLVYVSRYITSKAGTIAGLLFLLLTGGALQYFSHDPNIYQVNVTSAGVLLRILQERKPDPADGPAGILWTAAAIAPVLLEMGYWSTVHRFFRHHLPALAPLFVWSTVWCFLYAFVLLLAAGRSGPVRRLLECRLLRILSPLSFGIYLLHWPLLASVSLRLYLALVNRVSYSRIFVLEAVVSTLLVFPAAALWTAAGRWIRRH